MVLTLAGSTLQIALRVILTWFFFPHFGLAALPLLPVSAGLWQSVLAYLSDQTSSAISFTSLSFAHCSSSVSLLPISQDANPHCGLKYKRSSGTYFAASWILADYFFFVFQFRCLGCYKSKYDLLIAGYLCKWCKSAGSLVVIFQIICIYIFFSE